MLYLYLDESGDLGFDFENKRPSRFFTIAVLAVRGAENDRSLHTAVTRTARGRARSAGSAELKGTNESLVVKVALYRRIAHLPLEIFAVTLDKRLVSDARRQNAHRLYDRVAREAVRAVPLRTATNRISLVVDRSKTRKDVQEFNSYLVESLGDLVPLRVPFDIQHHVSHENPGVQAADLFAWGVFRKYERTDLGWYRVFEAKIAQDMMIE